MLEEWENCYYNDKLIPNYKVSNYGRVYSMMSNKILKPLMHPKGYLRVCLVLPDKTHKYIFIHRLVANAFIPNVGNYYTQVDHRDTNRTNNWVGNLTWVTASGNQRNPITLSENKPDFSGAKSPMYGRRGKNHPKYGIPNNPKACMCIETGKTYISTREAERITGIDSSSICRVCNGKRKTAGGYQWKYID